MTDYSPDGEGGHGRPVPHHAGYLGDLCAAGLALIETGERSCLLNDVGGPPAASTEDGVGPERYRVWAVAMLGADLATVRDLQLTDPDRATLGRESFPMCGASDFMVG